MILIDPVIRAAPVHWQVVVDVLGVLLTCMVASAMLRVSDDVVAVDGALVVS